MVEENAKAGKLRTTKSSLQENGAAVGSLHGTNLYKKGSNQPLFGFN
jgi:hypothetical protein